jgi:hypothetical protein
VGALREGGDGWHIASGLPKPAELAAAAGSAFLISAERVVADQALSDLGQCGIGLRRHEGFGDLAAAPDLKEGKNAREARERHRKQLMLSVAPLRGVPLRWEQQWPALRQALGGHISGDPASTTELHRMAAEPLDPGVGAALRTFLGLPPADQAYVAGELTR